MLPQWGAPIDRAMDVRPIIRGLRALEKALGPLIEALEDVQTNATNELFNARKHRGRTSMGEAERRDVSARMKKYWESEEGVRRRRGQTGRPGIPPQDPNR